MGLVLDFPAMTHTAAPTDRYAKSAAAHATARTLMPGGVSSPVRAYRAVGRDPVTIASGGGCRVTDVDGNEYIDYVGSYGPLILGHSAPEVVAALAKAAQKGTSFGMPTLLENGLAKRVIGRTPDSPRSMRCQLCSAPVPRGETDPSPVTTTLRPLMGQPS